MDDFPYVSGNPNNHSLVIPVDRESLGNFISGLLGRPQTIENRFWGTFDLNKTHIIDIFHLVDQRVRQQNKGQLIQFTVTIIYSDESSVLLNSFSDFETYRDVNDKISVAAELSWTYLIQFEDRPTLEKQVIELAIKTAKTKTKIAGTAIDLLFPSFQRLSNSFFLRIQHTARSWGADVEHLIAGKIKTWIKKEHWFKKAIYTNTGIVGIIAGLIFFSLAIYGIESISTSFESHLLETTKHIQTLSIDQKINYLIGENASPAWKKREDKKGISYVAAGMISTIIGLIIAGLADNPPKSYLALSEAAETDREASIKARKLDWAYFIVSAIGSTIAGVASRYIFQLFFGG